jgi:hypothetical protein
MKLHPAFTINGKPARSQAGKPVLGTYGRTDLGALALAKEVGMNLVFGGADLLDAETARGKFCLENGIEVMYPLTGHVHGRPSLSGDISANQTQIPIHAGAPLPGPGLVQIDDELIRYRESTPAALLGCERGADGTSPASHRAGLILFWPEPLAADVADIADSPNLFGYYVLDDTTGPALSALRALYRIVKRADGAGRPVCGGYSGATTLHNFAADAADVLLLYHYPVLKTGYERAVTSVETQWMMMEARARAPGVAFFGIYQAFWGGEWNKQQPLTTAELRDQMDDFVREGASGLIAFYLAPDDASFGGWNLNENMLRVIREVNHEIAGTGGLTIPAEPAELAQRRFQPTGHWVHPREVPGIVPAWHVIAPFPATGGKMLDTVFPPEREVKLDASYPGKERAIRWMTQRAVAGGIGLVELYGPLEFLQQCVAYATCTVTSPREQHVQMRFSSDDDAIVWLNQRQVWRHEGVRGVHWDADVVPVCLPAGESRILMKVCNTMGQWGFFMRFTDAGGKPLDNLTFSPTAEGG